MILKNRNRKKKLYDEGAERIHNNIKNKKERMRGK